MKTENHGSNSQLCFSSADILLPNLQNLSSWAVIACDQFTSQPEYWKTVEAETADQPSAAHLILPESELDNLSHDRVKRIHDTMLRYLQSGLFRTYPNSYIYTERTLLNGSVRCGVIGKIDLEAYDYSGGVDSPVRATEKTVTERIPPRMEVRRGAALELPHILLLCDDDRCRIIEPLHRMRSDLQQLYSFELMHGGGHVAGWLVSGEEKAALDQRLMDYAAHQKEKKPDSNLLFAVGDGNHSLATAKACFEEQKQVNPHFDFSGLPARYALCELNNIHDPSQCFEPIHRIVKNCDSAALLTDLFRFFPGSEGYQIDIISAQKHDSVFLPCEDGVLALSILQDYLDQWLSRNDGQLDYIHGQDALNALCAAPGTVGFLLPGIQKDQLFPGILSNGVLPRKAFSMGAATEKRYYLEARRIQ